MIDESEYLVIKAERERLTRFLCASAHTLSKEEFELLRITLRDPDKLLAEDHSCLPN